MLRVMKKAVVLAILLAFACRARDTSTNQVPQTKAVTTGIDAAASKASALAALHGTITRKGQPVADGYLQGSNLPAGTVHADASGTYRIDGLPPGTVRFFAASAELKAFSGRQRVTLAAGEDKRVDIDLKYAGRVKGVVVDEHGKPVPAVHVQLLNDANDMGESTTNAKGEFDVGSMSGGEYQPDVSPSPTAQPFKPLSGDRLPKISVQQDGVVDGIKLAVNVGTGLAAWKTSAGTGAIPNVPAQVTDALNSMGSHHTCTGVMWSRDGKTKVPMTSTRTNVLALDGAWIKGSTVAEIGEGDAKQTLKIESYLTWDANAGTWRSVFVANDGSVMVGTATMGSGRFETLSEMHGGLMGDGRFRERGEVTDAKHGMKMTSEVSKDGRTWTKVYEMTCG